MKLNINVLIGCVLCVVLIAVFGALNRTTDSRDDWRPSDAYSHVGGSTYSTASYSTGSSSSVDGLSVPAASMRGGNSMLRRRVSFSHAPAYNHAYSVASYGSTGSPISNSEASALYTTSSATMKSFGGGSAASGVSMSGGAVRATNSQSPIANSQLSIANIQSPIAYTQLPISNIQSPAMPNYQGIGNTTVGGPRAMRGRQNVGSMGGGSTGAGTAIENSWLAWMANYGIGMDGVTPNEDGSYGFDYYQLQNAYKEWVAWWKTWNMGSDCPSFDDFLTWFWKNDGKHSWTGDPTNENSTIFMHWVPVGDILPLLLMAMLYALIFFVRRNKTIQL